MQPSRGGVTLPALTSTLVEAMVSSCVLKGVDALNSTTRTCCGREGRGLRGMVGRYALETGVEPHTTASSRLTNLHLATATAITRRRAAPTTTHASMPHSHAHLPKLRQHLEQLRLVHHPPVGALALECDHAWQW